MKSFEPIRWLKRAAVENANERLEVDSEACPLPDQINALLIGRSRCACGRCHLNRAIRRGLLRESTRKSGNAERIANLRLSPGILAEMAAAMKAGVYILGVSVVFSIPLVALEEVSAPKSAAAFTVAFRPPIRLARSQVAVTSAQTASGRPPSTRNASVRPLVTVPEVIKMSPAVPSNFRVTAISQD